MDNWKEELEKLHLFDYENFSDDLKMANLESFIEKAITEAKIEVYKECKDLLFEKEYKAFGKIQKKLEQLVCKHDGRAQ